MTATILVINPNSSANVTAGIDNALAPLRSADGPALETLTLAEGPPGIESEAHVAGVAEPLVHLVRQREAGGPLAGVVVACFSDPGVPALREAAQSPIVGGAEAAYLTASHLAERFGIISIRGTSLARHRRHLRGLELAHRLAGDVPIERSVTDLADAAAFAVMRQAGERLVNEHGAGAVVLGCAGMAGQRPALQEALGVPVVEPAQAGAALALTRYRLSL